MGFVSWLRRLIGTAPKSVSRRIKVQANERVENRDRRIDHIKLRRDKKSRDRFLK
jgi:hypothetical protein